MWKRVAGWLGVSLLLASVFGRVAWGAEEEIAAIVNGQQITRSQLIEALLERAGPAMLEQLVDQLVIEQALAEKGIQVAPEQVDKRLAEFKEKQFQSDEERFEEYLKEYSLTEAALKTQFKLELGIEQLVKPQVKITDEDVKRRHQQEQQIMRVRHLQVAKEEEAQALRRRIEKGEDFATLAKQFSTDPNNANRGGDLGNVSYYGMAQYSVDFAEAMLKLKPGELSQPVKTPFGYSLILVEEIQPAPPLTRERAQLLRAELEEIALEQAKKQWFEEAKKKAKIEYRLFQSR